jgi:hypothetical protein
LILEKKATFDPKLGQRSPKTEKMKGISKLQGKWGVGAGQFWLIILTFALGGSLSGRVTSFLLKLLFLARLSPIFDHFMAIFCTFREFFYRPISIF